MKKEIAICTLISVILLSSCCISNGNDQENKFELNIDVLPYSGSNQSISIKMNNNLIYQKEFSKSDGPIKSPGKEIDKSTFEIYESTFEIEVIETILNLYNSGTFNIDNGEYLSIVVLEDSIIINQQKEQPAYL